MGITQATLNPQPAVYTFVDGGYLRAKFHGAMLRAFGTVPEIDFGMLRNFSRANRLFYYDCEVEDGTPSSEYQLWTERQFTLVRKADTCRLKLGTLRRSGKKKPASQKEVDVLLSVDLLACAFRQNMQEAVLIAGDLDFRPAIEEVVRHGTRVHLFYDESGVSQELLDSVDFRRSMSLSDYWQWTSTEYRESHPIPGIQAITTAAILVLAQPWRKG